MKKILYFDAFAGLSGDMILGSLINLIGDKDWFINEINKINIPDFEVTIEDKKVKGITSLKVNITFKEQKAHRHLKHINEIIDNSPYNKNVKNLAKEIFKNLAQAEALVHNSTIEKVHFHEVGAIDSIIDIVGCTILLDKINADEICCSSLPVGHGFVKCDHGKMPLPAPATIELLKGIPVYNAGIEGEFVTPTGASIIKTVCTNFDGFPDISIEKIGYGSGTIEREIPNLLRVVFGNSVKKKPVNNTSLSKQTLTT